ncbi:hypothetical protein GBA52_023086 [Prunus armeniaca]|nr:hypothetical protein GBA52_023086 [Prunus armeniaca]
MSWDPRPPGEDDPIYDDDCLFSIRMHHGGRLIHKYYVDGTVTYFDYVDKYKMFLIEIDCMAVYLGHVGRIDYWYKVEDDGELKRMEFDSEVIQMCENVPETDSSVYCRYSSQVYHYADDVRSLGVILQELPEFDKAIVVHDRLDKATSNEVHKTRKPTPSMNSATTKGKAKVAAVDEGSLQHETNRDTSKGKQKVAAFDDECVQHDTTKARTKGKQNVAEVDEGFVDAEINEMERKDQMRQKAKQRAQVLKEKRDKKKGRKCSNVYSRFKQSNWREEKN